jgi:phage tail sheath gpL-like
MTNDAVGTEIISKVVGYKIKKGNFSQVTPNLPQRIAILAEANEANQSTLDLSPKETLSAEQAGSIYGYGSPIYMIMRILRPKYSDGIGGIPTVVYPQAKASGAVAKVMDITPVGTATGNGTHKLYIAGRDGIDGLFYAINIVTGDTPEIISGKIEDAVNAVLGSPVIGTSTTTKATLTAKWAGLTSDDLNATIDTGDNALGITYAVTAPTSGSGTPSIQAALGLFGSNWNTVVINSYGTVSSVMALLEAFNGRPEEVPTGRFTGIIMKPFIALTGSVADDPSAITDARLDDVTIAICPAPLSKGLPMEAAANMALLFARVSQDTPHLDVFDMSYPDMPVPSNNLIGSMAQYNNRDAIVKKGCSTVDLVSGRYQVQDFVTTYHKLGELPPQFRYCRNLMLDFNVRFKYYLKEQIHVVGHAIASDYDTVLAPKVVKPKQWKQEVVELANELVQTGLIVEVDFMKDSIEVAISTTNPDRLETFFRYKRSGVARISSTVAEAGFNFGTLN